MCVCVVCFFFSLSSSSLCYLFAGMVSFSLCEIIYDWTIWWSTAFKADIFVCMCLCVCVLMVASVNIWIRNTLILNMAGCQLMSLRFFYSLLMFYSMSACLCLGFEIIVKIFVACGLKQYMCVCVYFGFGARNEI